MFMGVFLGDALGAPHEFRCNAQVPYTGILEHAPFMTTRWQGTKYLKVGQVTDDSEMTITLLRSLLRNQRYNRDDVISSYLTWANTPGTMLGKNTRALLKGVTTLKGYSNRIAKIHALPMTERTQSNGGLMRCSSLALLFDNEPVIQDISITNPNNVCIDCNLVYVTALRLALQGLPGRDIVNRIVPLAQTPEVREVIAHAQVYTARNLRENKGWCLHALWISLVVIQHFVDYSQAMAYIINCGGDTDTNACIAGALLGASLGFDHLQTEELTAKNIQILLSVNSEDEPTPRRTEYSPHDFYALTEAAYRLTTGHN